MITFQWQGVQIAVTPSGKLTLSGSCAAEPEVLDALGDVLLGMSRLMAVADATTTIGSAPTAAPALPQQAAPVAAFSQPATQVATPTAAITRAPAPVVVATGGLTKPGPQQTAAWLSGRAPRQERREAVAPHTAPSPAPAAVAEAPLSNAFTAPTPLPTRPSAPITARRNAPVTAVRGLVKPGPLRTAAFLAGDHSLPPLDLNEGLMTRVVREISKPGPMLTAQFLDRAALDSSDDEEAPLTAPATDLAEAAAEPAEPVAAVATSLPERVVTRRTPKGQLLREMRRWLTERGEPAMVSEFVAAAEAEGWSLATNVEPSIVSALRKHGTVFARNPDNTFALRQPRAPGKVVRRRGVRHPNDV